MNAVTTDAGSDSLLSRLEQLPVNAGVVLTFLIYPQRGIKSFHQARITVALTTVSRDVERFWFSQITLSRVLRAFFRVGIGVTAVTVITRQAARVMDVVIEELCRRA